MNIKKLKEEQLKLARKVIVKDDFSELNLIAGCDIAFSQDKMVAAIAVLDYKTLKIIEIKQIVTDPKIPYVPTYLSYREAPAIVEVFNQLEKKPDIMMCDCNGILHPRRIGCASHLGLNLDIPTIGVAKKLLCGVIKDGKVYVDDEPRAHVLITKEHAKPIYVSPGHRISLKTSLEIVKYCTREHKLPEPTRIAHRVAVRLKKEFKNQM